MSGLNALKSATRTLRHLGDVDKRRRGRGEQPGPSFTDFMIDRRTNREGDVAHPWRHIAQPLVQVRASLTSLSDQGRQLGYGLIRSTICIAGDEPEVRIGLWPVHWRVPVHRGLRASATRVSPHLASFSNSDNCTEQAFLIANHTDIKPGSTPRSTVKIAH